MAPPQTRVISLRNVTPIIPENPIHLEELKQDLARMRCEGLLDRPWALKREQMVWEMLQTERPNIFDGTIRDRRSPPAVDRGPVARHLQIPERRIRAGQPDGGPP